MVAPVGFCKITWYCEILQLATSLPSANFKHETLLSRPFLYSICCLRTSDLQTGAFQLLCWSGHETQEERESAGNQSGEQQIAPSLAACSVTI